jgi:chromosome partitioning protein
VRTLAFFNQKGGSCKTTSAVSLAAALGEKGSRVLLVDLDPQASASSWLGIKDGDRGLFEVFTDNGNLVDLVRQTDVSGVEVVPSSAWLVGVEKALAGEAGAETLLRRSLSHLPARWDFVFVDCPPSLGLLAVSALAACREVFVPLEASTMALAGLVGLIQTVDRVRERLNHGLEVSAVLVCRVDSRTNLSRDVVERLRQRFGDLVLETTIRETVRLREAWSFSKPITLYAPRSNGAEDYRAAAVELLKRTKRRS